MAYRNPFIVNGKIGFPANTSLVRHVEKWAKVRGFDKLACKGSTFHERDGVARDILWSDFSARNRTVGARHGKSRSRVMTTRPSLCPQNLDYLISCFGALYSGRIAVPLFDRAGASVGYTRCSTTVPRRRPDHHRLRREGVPQSSSRSPIGPERPRVIAVDGARKVRRHPAAAARANEGSSCRAWYVWVPPQLPSTAYWIHPSRPAHQWLQVLNALEDGRRPRRVSWLHSSTT